ncbi:MAG: hypothetical protein KF883_07090 [Thermomicrobiales bacterium]|nr:hypothetical protein [Thermomicrobiales bacterium]
MNFRHRWLVLLCAALILLGTPGTLLAAPNQPQSGAFQSAQNPDWLSSGSASRLAVGINVYAPSWIPSPFGGEPEIQAYSGFYSFYWLIPGAPVTYLRVAGEAGGTIPAYSIYDRNNQLQQNATVMGYPAWRDQTPAYDLVYWKIGNVVYTVDSQNMTGSDSLSLANSLVLVTPPASGSNEGNGGPVDVPSGRSVTIGAPATVQSGQTAAIGVTGEGNVLLTAQDGYFTATGENTVILEAGGTTDWVAPQYESDAKIYFVAYDPESGAELGSSSTYLEGFLSEGESVEATLECPPAVTIGHRGQIVLSGSGSMVVVASGGLFPAESPNTGFDTTAEGDANLGGTLSRNSSAVLGWLAPDEPGTYYLSVFDMSDTFLDECAVDAVTEDVDGNVDEAAAEEIDSGLMGDGTGVVGVDPSVVLRAIANPSGFSGDASGGPEANAPDYGYGIQSAVAESGDVTVASAASAQDSAAKANAAAEADLGPATGADGIVALSMGSPGGVLENPAGARIIVPQGALVDQTTVMLKPIADHDLPAINGVTLVPGTAFDVAFSAADGTAAEPLTAPAQLTIALDSASSDPSARIYRIDGAMAKLMPVVDADQGSVTTEVTELSRYVVGVPAPMVVGSTRSYNPFLVGLLALIALISAGLLISQGLSRRKTRMIPVRRPMPSRVRYR